MSPVWAAQREERFASLFTPAEVGCTYYSGHVQEGTSSTCLQRLMAQRDCVRFTSTSSMVKLLSVSLSVTSLVSYGAGGYRDRKKSASDQTVT